MLSLRFNECYAVLQILLRHRATKVNAQMFDGSTPLIVAVRLAVEGMVEELIGADADVNATDAHGTILGLLNDSVVLYIRLGC